MSLSSDCGNDRMELGCLTIGCSGRSAARPAAEPERYGCSTFPRSHPNPTRSTRLPILSLRVSTGCSLSQMIACEK